MANEMKQIRESKKDEDYIIDLCDEIIGQLSERHRSFPFLRGDTGKSLCVDAFYEQKSLVIEYDEKQHTEAVPFFDKRMTKSGISRGLQRKKYDKLREKVLPENGITLVRLRFSDFLHNSQKRLIRNRKKDIEVIRKAISNHLS